MLKTIRRKIRKIIRNSGFVRKIAPDFVDVMNEYNINVVLDVGANDGDYGREIRDRGYKGLIISFEPNPAAFERLQYNIKNDSNWLAYPFALGEKNGEMMFNISENDVMSSFKGLTKFGISKDTNIAKSIISKIITIDEFLNNNPIFCKNIYLKIDTQGFELEVLRGSIKYMSKIKAIQAEIALIHTYVDQIDWLDFLLWMRSHSFELTTAICNSAVNSQVREFDFVFIRK
jgi:FkbM family methyltransferase